MASAVPTFLSWLKKRIPDLPKDSHPPAASDEQTQAGKEPVNEASKPESDEGPMARPAAAPREPSGAPSESTDHAAEHAAHDKSHGHNRISLEKLRKRLSFQLRGDLAQIPAGTTTA